MERFINKIFFVNAAAVSRDPEQQIRLIKDTFLDFNKKLSSSGPINPTEEVKEKEKIIQQIKANREQLTGFIRSAGMRYLCSDFKHALFGKSTRTEWVYYNVYHSARHLHQLDKIHKQINK